MRCRNSIARIFPTKLHTKLLWIEFFWGGSHFGISVGQWVHMRFDLGKMSRKGSFTNMLKLKDLYLDAIC